MRDRSQIKLIFFLIILFWSCFNTNLDLEKKVEVEYSYYSNGKIEFSAEYINGKLDGLSKHWSEDGYLFSEAQYSNGKLHGYLRRYFPNGNLLAEINYFYGEKHGEEKWYYETGQLKSEQKFIYGLADGEIIRWHIDGSIIY